MPGTNAKDARPALLVAVLIAAACLLLAWQPAGSAAGERAAGAKHGKNAGKDKRGKARSGKRGKARRARSGRRSSRRAHTARQRQRLARQRRIRRLRQNRSVRLSGNVALDRRKRAKAGGSSSGVIDAGFEEGLMNWNTAGVGDLIPTVTHDVVRSGGGSARVVLTGNQERSELILGGNGGGSFNDAILFREGADAYYAFSFYIEEMVYGRPGGHNVIMQLKGDDSGSPYVGLQLWDYEGDDGEQGGRGLWSHGTGMGGDRFLAPLPERQWHDVVVHFRASGSGAGLYEVFLNGQLVDSASGVTTIPSGAEYFYVKTGLYRNGDEIPGTSALRVDAAKLGPTLASVLPG